MPELPEVETTRRGIDAVITGQALRRLVVREPRMRWPIPADLPALLADRPVLATDRRGKYLLLRFEHGVQIVHLGMSGSLRRVAMDEAPRKHDHVDWVFDHAILRLHDPRRFGAVLWHPATTGPVEAHPLLVGLGIEPFDPRFDGKWLHDHFRGKRVAVKQALLAGHAVVGVGNIYASESLFRAGIDPRLPAGKVSRPRCDRLADAVRATLADALASGGSTLRDYVGATGEPGAYFTIHAAVYERAGQPCRVCGTPVRRIVQGQRATYFCPHCQKR
ncbi:bifunctional DNA-formamidopyrimidine glycosylase/DNA-(apurinic or apyrimidinic site) lyase [Bordetella hinzii]|uniref:Formamidopyrimidine-DNA glycosylase n=1 Tax=Bordetella hinzii OH87 BAL007II TaxID=1331262 RepID=A0ABR4R508_9BORD|nr:bifunctional DNA-formamidopyrimidine glycosylase/DNA-(apurinic or apyrimidinic site) lyase [Bordetella hinzii]AKQ54090.1 Formamidopyrimidine-DNA glycosylase [Bordetella hinzii]KCB26028.1 DNA-formamidopyrimidine glycosylase [Bordetella hinzii OH87 BAL007II]KCB31865.1 DNA-formamidopyrimidine glycosylase [Bordetella hinzii L60]KCB40129.1 DNA-formamidopyrimidine glycosylase [Bordetella hinzii 5132]KCB49308.1 DNA-formamidopyrimidine glycosylase [Bordetella hinzii 4161]